MQWRAEVKSFPNLRAMRAKGRAVRVMRAMQATVQMLRIFIWYI